MKPEEVGAVDRPSGLKGIPSYWTSYQKSKNVGQTLLMWTAMELERILMRYVMVGCMQPNVCSGGIVALDVSANKHGTHITKHNDDIL